jgi:MFS superfamily sulfate permease-like transporter
MPIRLHIRARLTCLANTSQIIFIEQLVPMLGLAAVLSSPQASHDPPTTPIPKLLFIFEHLEHVNKTTAILSFSSLAVLIVARVMKQWAVQRPGGRWVRFVPEILIVVVGTTGE